MLQLLKRINEHSLGLSQAGTVAQEEVVDVRDDLVVEHHGGHVGCDNGSHPWKVIERICTHGEAPLLLQRRHIGHQG